jgi:hypothetical protein
MTDAKRPQTPVPSPETVTASRHHLTAQYARGVDRVLWEAEKRPMPDADAVHALVSAAANGDRVDALGIGASLVLTQAMRLDLDLLEADVLDAAQASGMSPESLAAVLELPSADQVEARHRMLAAKRELPRATVEPVTMSPGTHREASQGTHRQAADRAGRRAAQAKRRADELGCFGGSRELRRTRRAGSGQRRRGPADRQGSHRAGGARAAAGGGCPRAVRGPVRGTGRRDDWARRQRGPAATGARICPGSPRLSGDGRPLSRHRQASALNVVRSRGSP